MLPAAGPDLEHSNKPTPHDVYSRTGIVFAENQLSSLEVANVGHGSQTLKTSRLEAGEQVAVVEYFNNVH